MLFDVVVIGGGPGGYVCAIRCSQLGLSVALVEKENLGGVCLNRGCIPTKAFLHSAHLIESARYSSKYGAEVNLDKLDLRGVISNSQRVIEKLRGGIKHLMSKNKIKVFNGVGSFVSSTKIKVISENGPEGTIEAKHIVVATGSMPRRLPTVPDDLYKNKLVITSKEAVSFDRSVKKILVVGSGAIGIEFASYYRSMGLDVSVAEIADRILVMEDVEVSRLMQKNLENRGVRFILNAKLDNWRAKNTNDKLDVSINGQVEEFDVALLAIGVVPHLDDLNISNAGGIQTSACGNIVVDDKLQTTVKNIFAIGDIANPPFLAHKASKEGVIVAEYIAQNKVTKLPVVPACTYSFPQVASIGLTEDAAKEKHKNVLVGRAYFRANGKALASDDIDGFVKVVIDKDTDEILGAHMVGNEVSEMISLFSVAMTGEMTGREIMTAIFPHPTTSEVIQEAVMNAYGLDIHG